MKFAQLIKKKNQNLAQEKIPVLACLGDSVTQGCFEVYPTENGGIEAVFDSAYAYHALLQKKLRMAFPRVPVTVINGGISGDSAPGGLKRLDKDILAFQPDLVVVSYGLNDVGGGMKKLDEYRNALRGIFGEIQKSEAEVIFLTPNMLAAKISETFPNDNLKLFAGQLADKQNCGIMDLYMETACTVCKEYHVPVCDCYAKWKRLAELGADTTELLSNHLNHPTREMQQLFADALFEMILFS